MVKLSRRPEESSADRAVDLDPLATSGGPSGGGTRSNHEPARFKDLKRRGLHVSRITRTAQDRSAKGSSSLGGHAFETAGLDLTVSQLELSHCSREEGHALRTRLQKRK